MRLHPLPVMVAAVANVVAAFAPSLAAAAPATEATDTLRLSLASAPGAVMEMAPAARSSAPYGSDVGHLALGGSMGFGAGDFSTFKLNGDLQYTVSEISPKVYFDVAGHTGFGFGSGFFVFEMVPKARFRFPLDHKLSLYADAGMGFALIHQSFDFPVVNPLPPPVFITASASQTNGYGLFRFSGGIQYKVTPTVILVGEPLGFNVYFGSGTAFQYSFLVGALFRV